MLVLSEMLFHRKQNVINNPLGGDVLALLKWRKMSNTVPMNILRAEGAACMICLFQQI